MLNKKWMILSLLIGNILLISIACCNPIYTKAVLQRTLSRNLNDYMVEKNRYPGTVSMTGAFSKRNNEVIYLDQFIELNRYAKDLPQKYQLPLLQDITHYYLSSVRAYPQMTREGEKESKSLEIGFMTGLDDHIRLIAGTMFTDVPDESGVYDVIVSQSMFIKHNLLLNEEFSLPNHLDFEGNPLMIRISGVFTVKETEDLFWVRQPSSYTNQCFMPEPLFRELFVDLDDPKYMLNASFYQVYDYEAFRGDDVERILAISDAANNDITERSVFRYSDEFNKILREYQVKAMKVTTTLWVLQVPVFVLLAAFIFMVSQQMLQLEQNEIAILKSRGAGKRQILTVYILQSLILAAVALVVGIPLGSYLCQVLGSANAFLEFVRRKALVAEIDQTALLYALAAALFSILVMVLPVIRYSDVTIVSHKQKRSKNSSPWWQKTFLDVVLLGVSIYGLYTFNNQKELLAARVVDGASLDPLLFMSSSLFIIGAALFALRIIPIIVWLIFTVGKKLWSPALYASFLRVLRTRENQGFIMVFLMLTIALGIFNAQTARTVNTNEEERLNYDIGTDLIVKELWQDNSQSVETPEDVEYYEPDFGKYQVLDGVERVTKVLNLSNISMSVEGGTVNDIQLMGINTKEFGETAWFKDGLLDRHWYTYLNAISQNARAILVSQNFADNYGLEIGDVVYYKRKNVGSQVRGVVYGFIDYWPTYNSRAVMTGDDGLAQEQDAYLIVAHLSQLQANWGILPYEVWIKAKDSTQFIYDFAEEKGISFVKFEDLSKEIVTMKNDPIFQGTNGILTVSFIVVLLLCTTGFLIYWILSIYSRSLQFGIFRAMGMTLREILSMLINEQIFISGLSIACGALIGEIASKLYIPLIQIAYAASEQSLPLNIVSEQVDSMRLFTVIGVMMLLCMVILGILISKIKISQAIKLGED